MWLKKKKSTPVYIVFFLWAPPEMWCYKNFTFCALSPKGLGKQSSIFMRGDTNIFSLSGVNCQAGKQGRKSIQSLMLQSTYKGALWLSSVVFNNVASTVRA